MADRDQIMQALRNAHNAGDAEAARRLATMLQTSEPSGPGAMDYVAEAGRGAVPFYNEVRGAVGATMEKVAGSDESWSDLQEVYSGLAQDEQEALYEQDREGARLAHAAGLAGSILIPGAKVAQVGAKAGAKQMAREAAEAYASKPRLRVPAKAVKERVRVLPKTRKIRDPQFAVRVPATVGKPARTAIEGSTEAAGVLKSAKHPHLRALGTGALGATVGGAVGGPIGAAVGTGLTTPVGRKLLVRGVRKSMGDDAAEVTIHALNNANRKYLRELFKKLRSRIDA